MIFIVCRSQNYNATPSKKQCISPIFCNTKDVPISRIVRTQGKLSQDIIQDNAKVLYLFQCFQEAQDNQFCRRLAEMISREGCIDLENQVLHPYHVASLGFFLTNSKHKWRLLDLTSCHLEDEDFDELHHHLCVEGNKSTIERLYICNNNLTEASVSLLTDFISKFQLSCLNLCDNFYLHFAGLKDIFSTMTKVSTVKELYVEMTGIKMNDNTITMLDKEVICNMMSSLTVLHIGRNGLYDEGAELLSEGLVNTSSLKTLSAWNGNIHTKGAVALADALSKNSSLQVLDLHDNSIGDDGAVALANGLSKNTSLTALDISSNRIGDDGAVAFAGVLMTDNRTLEALGIRHNNNIGPTGFKALQSMAASKPFFIFYCS